MSIQDICRTSGSLVGLLQGELGWEVGAEWKLSNRFGFEVSYLDARHDVEAAFGVSTGIDFGLAHLGWRTARRFRPAGTIR